MHTKKNKACIFAIRGSCRLRDNTSLVFKIYWSDIVNSQSFTVYICPIFLWQNGWFSTFSSYGVLKYFDYSGSWSHPWPKGIHDSSPVTGLNPLVPACWISDALNHFSPFTSKTSPFAKAPFRGQSLPPPLLLLNGFGRQKIPVHPPELTWISKVTISGLTGVGMSDSLMAVWCSSFDVQSPGTYRIQMCANSPIL